MMAALVVLGYCTALLVGAAVYMQGVRWVYRQGVSCWAVEPHNDSVADLGECFYASCPVCSADRGRPRVAGVWAVPE